MKKIILAVSGIVVLFLLSTWGVKGYFCMNSTSPVLAEKEIAGQRNANLYNNILIDSAIHMLRSGNIVLRSGLGADSHMLAQMNRKDKTYSHCGIVMVENGYPFVYHSIGGEDNPDERLRRDSAQRFFSPIHNYGLAIVTYDFNAAQYAGLARVVQAFYRARPKFDMQFDLITDDKLYCSEFVYKALNRAAEDTGYIVPSKVLGKSFVGIDDLFINPHVRLVCRLKFK